MEREHTRSIRTEIADVDTLRVLLDRLNEVENWQPISRSELVTVEDVAEALNLDPDYVAQELEVIHQEHREARLAGVIRELEEPLYRVERIGHSVPDPLGNPLYKLRSVQMLAERNKSKPVLIRREEKPSASERIGQIIGYMMLAVLFLILVIFIIKTAIGTMTLR